MRCPYCGNTDSKVIDSRDAADGIRRRRECQGCQQRFTTYEYVQMRTMMVVKRDGRREEFQREKLFSSLTKACAKRPLPVGSIDKVVDEIERQLGESGRAEFTSRAVGELVMERLSDLDRVAWIRFASVYRDFRDIESFKEAIDALLQPESSENGVHPDQISLLEDDVVPPAQAADAKRLRRSISRMSESRLVGPSAMAVTLLRIFSSNMRS